MLTSLTGLQGKVHEEVVEFFMDYLFGIITKRELQRHLNTINPNLINLVGNGYLIRNCKLFVYARSKGKAKARDYGVVIEDKPLLSSIAQKLDISGCPVLTLKQFNQMETNLCLELKTYIGKFISKKLLFLTKSYGLSRSDIESQLLYKGLLSVIKRYPYFESELHAKNSAKTAIHNAGMDLIAQNTRGKTNRLIKNEDGTFEQKNIELSNLVNIEAPTPFTERMKDERSSLDSLLTKMNKRGCQFIKLARGEYDKEFSDFIGLDNTVACEQNYRSYLKKVQSFLNVNNRERDDWFSRLRKYL